MINLILGRYDSLAEIAAKINQLQSTGFIFNPVDLNNINGYKDGYTITNSSTRIKHMANDGLEQENFHIQTSGNSVSGKYGAMSITVSGATFIQVILNDKHLDVKSLTAEYADQLWSIVNKIKQLATVNQQAA